LDRLMLCILVVIAASCGGDDGPAAVAGLPAIAGNDWVGVWYDTERSGRSSLRATIRVDGNAVRVESSRPAGSTARVLTGSLDSTGAMRLTDGADGEVWSTFFGPASTNFIKLADYKERPFAGNGADDFFIIELSRRGGTLPANVTPTGPNTTRD
jgi:hypothetical protein